MICAAYAQITLMCTIHFEVHKSDVDPRPVFCD